MPNRIASDADDISYYLQIGYVITGAKTNFAVSPAAVTGKKLVVKNCIITLGSDSTNDISFRLAFAAATIPGDLDTGVVRLFAAHGKLPKGSGLIAGDGMSLAGERLFLSCGDPTPGVLIITYRYLIV